jgi:16S rRNA processing protein RimM
MPHRIPDDFRAIGRVVAPHGLQGALKVISWSDFPERFETLRWVYLKGVTGELARHEVKNVRFGSRHIFLKLEGLTHREQVEEYREAELLVPDEESWPLPPNRYYVSDLVGMEAVGTDETLLGRVIEIDAGGAQDILRVQGPYGELMIPLVDEWVPEIDIAARKIRVSNWKNLVNPEKSKDED